MRDRVVITNKKPTCRENISWSDKTDLISLFTSTVYSGRNIKNNKWEISLHVPTGIL